uniref:Caprin-1 dimerization domain-containing protein n=1 Tax=Glossina brevipalpis TaxID=37001 RepID=A0A1A9WCU0_9MUSC
MPSASNNNNTNTAKLVKQTSVNLVNSGGVSGSGSKTSGGSGIKSENATKSNTTTANETCSNKVVKEKSNMENSSATILATSIVHKDATNDALNPMKLTFTTIEHKIRNLEKRKTKLESYRSIQASGKELSSDQRAAVAKYDAVIATLEFARDLVKQMQQFTKDAEKEQKKQARKDMIAKAQAETVKIREVLIIQNILSCFTDDAVRNDFLSGENGATKLLTPELAILEKFCLDVQTRRPETLEDVPFAITAQKAAEVFSMTIDGRPKQYGETTYENVRRLFQRVQESNYLDKIYLTDMPELENNIIEDEHSVEQTGSDNEETLQNQGKELSPKEGIEKLTSDGVPVSGASEMIGIALLASPTQSKIGELEVQQKQSQQSHSTAISGLSAAQGQPIMQTPMAPPATAVPAFQAGPPPQAPSRATTPVHVTMFSHQPIQAPTPQVTPLPGSGLISGVPQSQTGPIIPGLPSQQAATQQPNKRRQMLNSPAGGSSGTVPPIQHMQGSTTEQAPPAAHFNPPTVHTVEQSFFKQHPQQQQHQFLQQIRPLAEVIGGGNFYFLQDSELDSPDLNVGQAVSGPQQSSIIFDQQPPQPQQTSQAQANTINQQLTQKSPQQKQNVLTHNERDSQTCAPKQQTPLGTQQITQHAQSLPTPSQPPQSLQTHIQSQTFTNQSFPQITPQASLGSNTASPLFQPQKPSANAQQLFSPVAQALQPSQQQQQQPQLMLVSEQQPQQQQPMMIMARLGATQGTTMLPQQALTQPPQSQLTPTPHNLVSASGIQSHQPSLSAVDVNSTSKNSGFPFENPVVTGLASYEQQMPQQLPASAEEQTKINSQNAIIKADIITEWGDSNLKSTSAVLSPNANVDLKPNVIESSTWSNELNANANTSNAIAQQQQQSRKNEWTASSAAAAGDGSGYGSDSRPESNHWHAQPESGGYGRGSRTTGNSGGGYPRRNDDRRPGGNMGSYRGSRSNYGQTGQPNGSGSRGGGSGGMYFRNNDNSNNSSYYQNGSGGAGGGTSGSSVYSTNKDSRYDAGSGGGNNYRGPRGSASSGANARNSGPPPRSLGTSRNPGGGISNTNSSASYINSRQSTNRMSLGLENKN